jgi:hypothetical protein
MTDPEINWALIQALATNPHPALHIADRDEGDLPTGVGEVLMEARATQHLLDLIGIPSGLGTAYASHIDARTYLAIRKVIDLGERLDRIATWHSRETGPGGMVGDFCVTCEGRWPCDTRRMAEGTYTDEAVTS